MISGTAAGETLNGTSGSECLVGLAGNDTINASGSNDDLLGGDGVDTLYGSTGADLISGGLGNDVLRGDAGNDTMFGGQGDDEIRGGADADVIYPGMGRDVVLAESGNDKVVVHDICELQNLESLDGGSGTDILEIPVPLSELTAIGVSVAGFETITVNASSTCLAECRLPCDAVDPAFLRWVDPTVWATDATTGVRFRRTTAAERTANHWLLGTYLVEDTALVSGAATGAGTLNLRLPVSATALQSIALNKTGSSAYMSKVERRVTSTGLQVAVTKPTVNTYLQAGFTPSSPRPVNNAWVQAITTDDGEILVVGAHASKRVRVDGSNPGWTLSSVPVAAGQPAIISAGVVAVVVQSLGSYGATSFGDCINQSPVACGWLCANTSVPCGTNDHGADPDECSDGIDNDADGIPGNLQIDSGDTECQHSDDYSCSEHPDRSHRWESGESFAIFADGRFCTQFQANWFGELTQRGWEAEALLNDAPVGNANGEARYVAGGCWVFPSVADAHACTFSGSCSAWASSYPYKNAGTGAGSFYNKSWLDAGHGAEYGLDDALHQAVTLYYGYNGNIVGSEPQIVDLTCGDGQVGGGCCGAMSWGSCTSVGASVAVFDSHGGSSCRENDSAARIAHEMGHNLAMVHDSMNPPSFMNAAGQYKNGDVSPANATQAEIGLEDPECGRRPGFEWIGQGNSCGGCP